MIILVNLASQEVYPTYLKVQKKNKINPCQIRKKSLMTLGNIIPNEKIKFSE